MAAPNDAGAKPVEPKMDPLGFLRSTLNSALRGKAEVIEHVLGCLLAQGHLLVEDLPGLGKTTLAKALAQAVGGTLKFIPIHRVQHR